MTILLYITLIIQIGYWYFLFNKTGLIDKYTTNNHENKSVTIIICSKNELQGLQNNLPTILRQNHPNCTLMVADDFSQDGSKDYLKAIDNEKMVFRYFKVKKNKLGKKQALKEAISNSLSEHLLLTDADCKPVSASWARLMTKALNNDEINLVLGYSPYTINASKLSIWVHYEAWLTAVLADKKNTAICLDKDSFVYTMPPSNYKAYFAQKKRHYSTANRYKLHHKVLLSLYSLSQILFYSLVIFLLVQGSFTVAIVCYFIRLLLIFPVVSKWRNRLDGKFHLLLFPILDFIQAIHYLIFSFAVLIPTKQKW